MHTVPQLSAHFPSFSEGLSLRASRRLSPARLDRTFPFLFGGTFIEGVASSHSHTEGLKFPFLFGGTFIEGGTKLMRCTFRTEFPFLFGGTFIEGTLSAPSNGVLMHFPSFSEGLSLRGDQHHPDRVQVLISLPFRRDFH